MAKKKRKIVDTEASVSIEMPKDLKKKKKKDEPVKSMPRDIFEILMYGLSLLIFFKAFVWQNFQIPTKSMENSLLIGDHITANTFIFKNASEWEKKVFPFRDVKRGDVVVFKFPGHSKEDWIKRCVGVPGDVFEIIDDQVYLDGKPLIEEYPFYKNTQTGGSDRDPDIKNRPLGYYEMKPGLENADERMHVHKKLRQLFAETINRLRNYRNLDPDVYNSIIDRMAVQDMDSEKLEIPEGFYLMMGDNRNHSHDSRAWGLVPREFVQGRAYFLWWSYGEDENSHTTEGWDRIWSYLRVVYTFFTLTHWDTTFTLIK